MKPSEIYEYIESFRTQIESVPVTPQGEVMVYQRSILNLLNNYKAAIDALVKVGIRVGVEYE